MADKQKQGGALTTFVGTGGLPVNIDARAAAAALSGAARQGSTGSGDGKFLSFSGKAGRYSMGREKDDVDPDAVFIIEPLASVEGWTCWKGGNAVAKHEWSVFQRDTHAVPAGQLADHGPYNERAGEGWSFMMGIGLIEDGEPETSIKFTTNSVSGRNEVSALFDEMARHMDDDGGLMLPIVQLGSEQFTAQGQKNYKPKIDVIGWATRAEVAAYFEGDYTIDDLLEGGVEVAAAEVEEVADEPAPEPPRRKRRAAA